MDDIQNCGSYRIMKCEEQYEYVSCMHTNTPSYSVEVAVLMECDAMFDR
jgi:hypothetical protein